MFESCSIAVILVSGDSTSATLPGDALNEWNVYVHGHKLAGFFIRAQSICKTQHPHSLDKTSSWNCWTAAFLRLVITTTQTTTAVQITNTATRHEPNTPMTTTNVLSSEELVVVTVDEVV